MSSKPQVDPSTITGSEVLSLFVEFVPTYPTPINVVRAILPPFHCDLLGTGSLRSFLAKFSGLYFDLSIHSETKEWLVRLRDDVSHPLSGCANEKFIKIGSSVLPRDDFLVLDESLGKESTVKPQTPPPALAVNLRVSSPVLKRLCSLIPEEFQEISQLEDRIPRDVLFHPYFDTQGGLRTIAGKFPEVFQCVDDKIRLKPVGLAPHASDEYGIGNSPCIDVAQVVEEHVRRDSVPQWISLTSIYETLSIEQRKSMKRKGFKSFASFVRAHGRALCISNDLLFVSRWDPPQTSPSTRSTSTDFVELIHSRMKSGYCSVADIFELLPDEKESFPSDLVTILKDDSRFEVSNRNGLDVFRRRPIGTVTPDILASIKEYIGDEGISLVFLNDKIATDHRLRDVDLEEVLRLYPEDFELLDGDIFIKS